MDAKHEPLLKSLRAEVMTLVRNVPIDSFGYGQTADDATAKALDKALLFLAERNCGNCEHMSAFNLVSVEHPDDYCHKEVTNCVEPEEFFCCHWTARTDGLDRAQHGPKPGKGL